MAVIHSTPEEDAAEERAYEAERNDRIAFYRDEYLPVRTLHDLLDEYARHRQAFRDDFGNEDAGLQMRLIEDEITNRINN